jgi:uncharacterized ubiquitin-like protein YukD
MSLLPAYNQDTIPMEIGGVAVQAIVQNDDTIYVSELEQAVIKPLKRNASKRDMRQYRKLIYNVKKVYPYAKLAGRMYGVVITHLQSLQTEKERREYIKLVEKDLLTQYEEELKNLTVTQGKILIKLIDRETQSTSFDVVKELRGSFQAAFWQAIARIFGSSLKTEFDAEGEDKVLNEIMIMIEKGEL